MTDDLAPTASQPETGPASESGFGRHGGPARSSRGKLVIGAVLLLAVVLAAAAVFFLFGHASPTDTADSNVAVAQNGTAPAAPSSTAPAQASEQAVAPAQVALDEVFTFRDVFVPLVKAAVSSTASSETSTPGSTPQTSDNTILLQDIMVENGERTAVLIWNGQTYNVQPGDEISDSPWKVLEIRADSVVMLYGDTQVVLSVGQAVSK